MNACFAIAAAAIVTTMSLQAHSADLQFPSVSVGQALQFEFTLTTAGGSPIPGIEVSLSVPDACGGVSPDRLTTDSSGKGRFEFLAGNRPGVCAIVGSSGNASVTGRTTVYRPDDVVLGGNPLVDDIFWRPGSSNLFAVNLKAAGLALPLVPLTLGTSAPGGPTVVGSTQLTTDASGAFTVRVTEGSAPGIYDIPISFPGGTRHVRLRQGQLSDRQLMGPYRQWVQASQDPAVVVLPDGAAGPCAMGGASKSVVQSFGTPPGMVEFFNDLIKLSVQCTRSSTRVRIEYPEPIPTDGVLWWYHLVPGVGYRYTALPGEAVGNAITFTLPELADGGSFLEATFGMARPGTPPAPPIPDVQDMWWGGSAENGWGVAIIRRAATFAGTFAAIFAYDDAGEPTWWVMTLGQWKTGRGPQFTAPAYAPAGTPWFAYEPGITYVGEPAGRVQFRFTAGDRGEMDFTLHGAAGRKALQRQLFGGAATTPRPDVSGLWWGGQAQSGWGISVVQQGDKLFSVWYTYDAANKPTWYVMPDGRWSNAATYEGRIYRTRGSPLLRGAYDPSRLVVTDVGSFRFDFGAATTFTYTLEGRSGTLQLQRDPSY